MGFANYRPTRLTWEKRNRPMIFLKGHDELCRAYIKRITNYEDQKRCLTCPFCSRKMTFTKSFEMGHYLRHLRTEVCKNGTFADRIRRFLDSNQPRLFQLLVTEQDFEDAAFIYITCPVKCGTIFISDTVATNYSHTTFMLRTHIQDNLRRCSKLTRFYKAIENNTVVGEEESADILSENEANRGQDCCSVVVVNGTNDHTIQSSLLTTRYTSYAYCKPGTINFKNRYSVSNPKGYQPYHMKYKQVLHKYEEMCGGSSIVIGYGQFAGVAEALLIIIARHFGTQFNTSYEWTAFYREGVTPTVIERVFNQIVRFYSKLGE